MESMAYLTAGTLDSYDDPDMSVEAAMVKVSHFLERERERERQTDRQTHRQTKGDESM